MGDAVKRAFNAIVVVLAAAAFFAVPVGKKTLAGHFVAIFSTAPARELGGSLESVLGEAKKKARLDLDKTRPVEAPRRLAR